eukprot:14240079-Alexandrium_andersonii.AAC.1
MDGPSPGRVAPLFRQVVFLAMAGSSDHPLGAASAARWLVDSVRRSGGGPRVDGGTVRVVGDWGTPGDYAVG